MLFASGNILIAIIIGIKNYWRAKQKFLLLSAGTFLLAASLAVLLLTAYNRENEYKRREYYQQGTRADVILKDITPKQDMDSKKLEKNGLIRAGMRQRFGQLCTQGGEILPSCVIADLYAMDEGAAFLCFCQPLKGRFPKERMEIALSKRTLEKLSAPVKLGETLFLQVKDIDSELIRTLQMKLVGILDGGKTAADYGLVSDQLANSQAKGRCDVLYTLSDKQMKLTELGSRIRLFTENSGIHFYEINYLDGRYQAVWADLLPYLPLLVLISACGYLFFLNIFAVKLHMDQKSMALLEKIGMSKKQKACMNAAQIVCQALPAILSGSLLGTLAAQELNRLSAHDIEMLYWQYFSGIFECPVWIYLFAGVYCMCVLFSAALTAAYGQQGTKGAIQNGFGRNGSKFCIVVSLVLCEISVNQIFSFATAMDAGKYQSAQMSRDCVAASENAWNPMKGFITRSDGLSRKLTDYLETLPVQKPALLYKNTWEDKNVGFDYGIQISDAERELWINGIPRWEGCAKNWNGQVYHVMLSEDGYPSCNVYGISKEHMDSFIFLDEQINVWRKLASGKYVIYGVPVHDQNQRADFVENNIYQLKGPKTITAYKNGDACGVYQVIYALIDASVIETPEHGNGSIKVGGDAPYLYFAADTFQKLYLEKTILNMTFSIEEKNQCKVEKALQEIREIGFDLNYMWKSDTAVVFQNEKYGRYAYGILLGILISLFALLNAASLLIRLLWIRDGELAILEAVGMTKKQVRDRVRFDYIVLAGVSAVPGLAGAVLCEYGFCRRIMEQQNYTTWRFTILPAVAVIVIFVVLSFLLSSLLFHLHKGTEKSIGERMKA